MKDKTIYTILIIGAASFLVIALYKHFIKSAPGTAKGQGNPSNAISGYAFLANPGVKSPGWQLDSVTATTLKDYITGGNAIQDNGVSQTQNYNNLMNFMAGQGSWQPNLPQPNTGTGFVGVPGKNSSGGGGGIGGLLAGSNGGKVLSNIISVASLV